MLSSIDICHETDELIDRNLKNASADMRNEILAFVAEELSLVNNDADFLRKPTRFGPQLLSLRAVGSCIDSACTYRTIPESARDALHSS